MHLTLEELKSKYPDIFSEYSSVNEIDWRFISDNFRLSEEFIREFSDKVNWYNISYSQKLSEDFIREFKDKVNWRLISNNQELSESFIREFKDKVDWSYISARQKLSESFIREFKDKVYWSHISCYQKLSDEFCKEFNIESTILDSVFHCGQYSRTIYIKKESPDIIYIGCFKGTKPEAIDSISKKYSGQEYIDYISKVEQCFNF